MGVVVSCGNIWGGHGSGVPRMHVSLPRVSDLGLEQAHLMGHGLMFMCLATLVVLVCSYSSGSGWPQFHGLPSAMKHHLHRDCDHEGMVPNTKGLPLYGMGIKTIQPSSTGSKQTRQTCNKKRD